MYQFKRILVLLAVVFALVSGKLWADNAAPTATPAKPAAAAKPVKAESPSMSAMKAAIALEDAGNTAEAIAAFEKMGVCKTKNMEAWRLNNEAHVYLISDQADKAVSLLEKATETNDQNYVAWNNLGSAYENTNQLDKAKDAYQKSIDAAKTAEASSAKAEGNLQNLQARMDRMAAKAEKMAAKKGGVKPATTPEAKTTPVAPKK